MNPFGNGLLLSFATAGALAAAGMIQKRGSRATRTISADEFMDTYFPEDFSLGNHIITSPSDVAAALKAQTLWTLLETDTGSMILPGRYVVNRMDYLRTDTPWNAADLGTLEVEWTHDADLD